MTILLIDGDQFIFKATAALEREIQWDDQNHVLYSNAEECWTLLNDMLRRIFERFDTHSHALTFTTAPNFRREIDPTYKMGRSTRKPLCYYELRERVEFEGYNVVSMPGLEADDVMGILATKPGQAPAIIVSQDKDMKSIPGVVWDGEDLVTVTEQEANYFHMMQTLTGDTSDGYKGCPGVGPKKAEKLLNEAVTDNEHISVDNTACMWLSVVAAFEKAGLTEADALVQARLARILRWSDWDSENKKPILWTPPS